MLPAAIPRLVPKDGVAVLRKAIADPDRYVVEANVAGVHGLVVCNRDERVETGNGHGVRRDSLRGDGFEARVRRLAHRLPIISHGTVLIVIANRPVVSSPSDRSVIGVLKDRPSMYRDGTRTGWWKAKDPRWIERLASRFERR